MPSQFPTDDTDWLARQIAALTGSLPTRLSLGGKGGNNRLYRAETDHGVFAVKHYLRHPGDQRDRLGAEFAALTFLTSQGVGCVPQPIAATPESGLAIYQWVDGDAVELRLPGELDQMADFIACLDQLTISPDAVKLPPASESCLSAGELIDQVLSRTERLRRDAVAHAGLRAFLGGEFSNAVDQVIDRCSRGYQVQGWEKGAPLPLPDRTLSPSDFGTHNALRRPDGRLVFMDFEYFGWDDPVKLVADTLLHPGMALSEREQAAFRQRMLTVFGRQPAFAPRLALLLPLYALRWTMIVLNPFLPERWDRLAFATGGEVDREIILARQLEKARRFTRLAIDGLTPAPKLDPIC